ncbi:agmatine deiminase family protein [Parvularcula dongshanensis]|uniref:Agmatine deiminase n=1 Tax=Parvularcula dongshanensis TaxID=1173995 RepID=A0A840I5G9_9PROT|nr:agmatine deiminase family protein [Parvularcula dongshanensis]MBB4659408.1 agmatine deiminase [Parvularcula dongshanensis]
MTNPSSLPPEWAPQRALWVGWPRLDHEWSGGMEAARDEIAAFVRAASRFVPVRLAAGDEAAAAAAHKRGLDTVCEVVRIPTGDIWLRDTGPLLTEDGRALCFAFNGWGGKYDMEGDAETASAIARAEGSLAEAFGFVLEGGSLDFDGEGRLLTTRQCLLNPNRNGEVTEGEVETLLKDALGGTEVIWLGRGLHGDHTDGHVDNLARFTGPGRAVCQAPYGDDDPHADVLAEAERDLRAAGLDVATIPSPGRILDADGEVLPASHMNFTITNGAVLLPIYDEASGAAAREALAPLFPGREVVALPARAILEGGGGAFHCMTREVPGAA